MDHYFGAAWSREQNGKEGNGKKENGRKFKGTEKLLKVETTEINCKIFA